MSGPKNQSRFIPLIIDLDHKTKTATEVKYNDKNEWLDTGRESFIPSTPGQTVHTKSATLGEPVPVGDQDNRPANPGQTAAEDLVSSEEVSPSSIAPLPPPEISSDRTFVLDSTIILNEVGFEEPTLSPSIKKNDIHGTVTLKNIPKALNQNSEPTKSLNLNDLKSFVLDDESIQSIDSKLQHDSFSTPTLSTKHIEPVEPKKSRSIYADEIFSIQQSKAALQSLTSFADADDDRAHNRKSNSVWASHFVSTVSLSADQRQILDAGIACSQMGFFSEALTLFESLNNIEKFAFRSRALYAEVVLEMINSGMKDEAVSYKALQYLESFSHDSDLEDIDQVLVQYLRARILQELGQLEQALELYTWIESKQVGFRDTDFRIDALNS